MHVYSTRSLDWWTNTVKYIHELTGQLSELEKDFDTNGRVVYVCFPSGLNWSSEDQMFIVLQIVMYSMEPTMICYQNLKYKYLKCGYFLCKLGKTPNVVEPYGKHTIEVHDCHKYCLQYPYSRSDRVTGVSVFVEMSIF